MKESPPPHPKDIQSERKVEKEENCVVEGDIKCCCFLEEGRRPDPRNTRE